MKLKSGVGQYFFTSGALIIHYIVPYSTNILWAINFVDFKNFDFAENKIHRLQA